jgi:hypothetical protein
MPEKPRSCPPCSTPPEPRRAWDESTTAPRTTDYDEEEIARKMSISTGLAFVEWGKTDAKVKINLLDTPGFNMFVHEAKMVLPVVDAALVVVDGVAGVEVVTQRVWAYCNDIDLPRMIVVNRMDRDRADANSRARIAHQRLRPRGDSAAASHRQREESQRHRRSGPHEGLHLRDGRKRQGQRRADSRRTWRTSPRKRTKNWWSLSPRAKMS